MATAKTSKVEGLRGCVEVAPNVWVHQSYVSETEGSGSILFKGLRESWATQHHDLRLLDLKRATNPSIVPSRKRRSVKPLEGEKHGKNA